MFWLVVLLGYLLNHVAHDMRVGLAQFVVRRLRDAVSDPAISTRKLAALARLEDRLTRLVRAIVHARADVLAGFDEYLEVERKAFRRRATCAVELRRRIAFLAAVLGSVDAFCRRLLRVCIHARSRRRRTATPRRASRAIARPASLGAAIAPASPRALDLSG